MVYIVWLLICLILPVHLINLLDKCWFTFRLALLILVRFRLEYSHILLHPLGDN